MSAADLVGALRCLHLRVVGLERAGRSGAPDHVLRLGGDLGSITIDGESVRYLSEGDDGHVVVCRQEEEPREYAIKVYRTKLEAPEVLEEMQRVTKDQATREFTALTLLAGHPNVFALVSTEVDECRLRMNPSKEYMPWTSAVRLEYVHGLWEVEANEIGKFFGVVKGAEGGFMVDYGHRDRLARYLFGQAASLACALKEKGIYHRDVEACNVRIQLPQLRIFLMDFARARVPGMRDPEEILDDDSVVERVVKKRKTVSGPVPLYIENLKREVERRYNNFNEDHNTDHYRLYKHTEVPEVGDHEMLYYLIHQMLLRNARGYWYQSELQYFKGNVLGFAREKFVSDLKALLPWAEVPEDDVRIYRDMYEQSSDVFIVWGRSPEIHSEGFEEFKAAQPEGDE